MEPVALSWLVASAAAPLVALLAVWTLYIFHTYRRRWRTVDLFLLAVSTQELITALFVFGFSVLSLIHPSLEAPCGFVIWGMTATRTFQITTLASLVVDRALTVRWPYRYRFSVRRNQIRYHIAVLAVVSVFVGVAAVFARTPAAEPAADPFLPGAGVSARRSAHQGTCSVHPLRWDLKFTVFVICLHAVLMLVSLFCWLDVELHRCSKRTRAQFRVQQQSSVSGRTQDCQLPTPSDGSPVDSTTGTASSTSSTRPLHRPGRQESRRPYGSDRSASEFRWTAVAVVSLLCYCLNHLPFVALMIMGTLLPTFWSLWQENIIVWLRLLEGILMPVALYLTDSPHRGALKRTFHRRSGRLSTFASEDGRFRMFFDDDNLKIGSFGSVTPVGIITNYRRTPGCKRDKGKRRSSLFGEKKKPYGRYMLPSIYGVDAILEKPTCLHDLVRMHPHPDRVELDSIAKASSLDTELPQYSLGTWRGDIYATLSDNYSTFSYQSTLVDDSSLRRHQLDDEIYGGSFTTIANDDFEFHDTRPCGGEVRMRPALDYSHIEEEYSVADRKMWTTGSFQKHSDGGLQDNSDALSGCSSSPEQVEDLVFHFNNGFNSKGYDNPAFVKDSTKDSPQNGFPLHVYRVNADELRRNALLPLRTTSFSMNDLDLIESAADGKKGNGGSEDEEMVYVFPVKSGSTMSLYKVSLDEEQELGKSVSENNLIWDGDSRTLGELWRGGRSSAVFRPHSRPRRRLKFDRRQKSSVHLNRIQRTHSDKKQQRPSVENNNEGLSPEAVRFNALLSALAASRLPGDCHRQARRTSDTVPQTLTVSHFL